MAQVFVPLAFVNRIFITTSFSAIPSAFQYPSLKPGEAHARTIDLVCAFISLALRTVSLPSVTIRCRKALIYFLINFATHASPHYLSPHPLTLVMIITLLLFVANFMVFGVAIFGLHQRDPSNSCLLQRRVFLGMRPQTDARRKGPSGCRPPDPSLNSPTPPISSSHPSPRPFFLPLSPCLAFPHFTPCPVNATRILPSSLCLPLLITAQRLSYPASLRRYQQHSELSFISLPPITL